MNSHARHPDLRSAVATRAEPVKDARRPPRSVLDGREHDGTLDTGGRRSLRIRPCAKFHLGADYADLHRHEHSIAMRVYYRSGSAGGSACTRNAASAMRTPAHHTLEVYLDAYVAAANIRGKRPDRTPRTHRYQRESDGQRNGVPPAVSGTPDWSLRRHCDGLKLLVVEGGWCEISVSLDQPGRVVEFAER